MKYFKDPNNNVYAYEDDGSQDSLIGDKIQITKEEAFYITNPPKTNEEKRKESLSELSTRYQEDIYKLNTAWLAAAVSDGVSEGTKKDAVIVQIDARKAQYASDRAAIIAQYP